ncbi:NUDIX domain-containing protein [Nocardioides sp.]|uniref:NUDIX hydrolase n=1 Tax=Nocardioides sp. TaxID=35761 RepID=UPI002737124E|nr:NUDIX domain-containing protein [Nocardioides sp.]MDP3891010.1 NUDIX domain-containing protein [Nocardioides sp.]
MARHESDYPFVYVTVDIVVLTLRSEGLSVLAIRRDQPPYAGELALPGGFVGPDEDLLAAARRELTEETGLDGRRLVLDQLATYGAPDRDPRHRIVSVAHLAVTPVAETPHAGSDARSADWLPVAEVAGKMAFDHDQILTDAITRLRGKLEYTALATSFLPEEFTLAELRGVYETIWGTVLDPGNFQRKIRSCTDFVRPTGELRSVGRGRPAELFVALKSGTDRLAVPIIGAYI